MSAQPSELSARLIDLFGNPGTADPTKLYGNFTVNPNGTITIGTGLILPDGYTRNLTDMGRNRIINGGFDFWQRATTFTGTLATYQTADRFGCNTASGSGHNAALSTDVPNNAFAYSWKFTVGTGAAPTAGQFSGIWQNIEGYNVIDFAYGKSTAQYGVLTFWVKSSIAGTYCVGFMNNALNRNYIANYTISNANTWQQIAVIVPGDTAGTWNNQNLTGLSICWDLGTGSTFQTATLNTWQAGQMYGTAASTKLISTTGATWQLTGVQWELGSYNSPFERRMVSTELNNCMRYFERMAGGNYGAGSQNGTTLSYNLVQFQVPKRAAPTMGNTAVGTFYLYNGLGNLVPSAISWPTATTRQALASVTFGASGAGGGATILEDQASSYIDINSEL